ncbi:MAG: EamA family transporter [Clostridia bacterium]|nr:EamA family transporter [Clostridia bacterium]
MKKYSYAFVLASGILWGMIGVFVNNLLASGFTRMQITVIRMAVATAVLGIYMLLREKKDFKIRLRDLWCFLGTGLASILLLNVTYFYSIEQNGMSVAAVLLYTSPVFVMLMSAVLFKEKLTAKKIAVLPLVIAGCVLVTGLAESFSGATVNTVGILMGIASGFAYALYSIFGRYALDKGYSCYTISFYSFAFSAAAAIPFSGFSANLHLFADAKNILFSLGLGIISCVLPYIFYTKGLEGTENSKAAVIATVEPVTAAVVGILLFKESITAAKLAGMVLILLGIVMLNINFSKKSKQI